MNNREITKLTQKIMDLRFDLRKLKNPKEISQIKEKIMWLVQEINVLDNAQGTSSEKLMSELTTSTKIMNSVKVNHSL